MTNEDLVGDFMSEKRFVMTVVNDKHQKEVSIIDTEEDNVQLFCCTVEEEDLLFIKWELEQILNMLNFQNSCIKKLTEKIEGLEHQIFAGYDLY